uniref:Serine (or cysteine) peptidase inhibitor, clade F, member 1 n=1 Tax=Mus musculus TaxID=10090 RepID=E9PXR9_MOUSE
MQALVLLLWTGALLGHGSSQNVPSSSENFESNPALLPLWRSPMGPGPGSSRATLE